MATSFRSRTGCRRRPRPPKAPAAPSGPARPDVVMRILVFGGWGQLGSDLAKASAGRHLLARPAHSEVDVTDPGSVAGVVSAERPDAVVNAAAFHKVEVCEQDPTTTFAVNAIGALHVARAAREAAARCAFVSTDYVFDGEKPDGYSEDDAVSPL